MRFLTELRHPDLKCLRVGHDVTQKERRGYEKAKAFSACVAYGVSQTCNYCYRCKKQLTEWTESNRYSIHSITLPKEDHDKLEKEGVIWYDR